VALGNLGDHQLKSITNLDLVDSPISTYTPSEAAADALMGG